MLDAYLYDGLRTPIGRHAGKLAPVRPDDLAAEVIKEVVARNQIAPAEISDVVMGCVTQAGEEALSPTRDNSSRTVMSTRSIARPSTMNR